MNSFSIHDVLGKVIRIQHPQTGSMVMGIGWIVCGYHGTQGTHVHLRSVTTGTSEALSYNLLRKRFLDGTYVVDYETTVSLALEAA